jgi:hypothetical protein
MGIEPKKIATSRKIKFILIDLLSIHLGATLIRTTFLFALMPFVSGGGSFLLMKSFLFSGQVVLFTYSFTFLAYYTFCLYFLEGETLGGLQTKLSLRPRDQSRLFFAFLQSVFYLLNLYSLGLLFLLSPSSRSHKKGNFGYQLRDKNELSLTESYKNQKGCPLLQDTSVGQTIPFKTLEKASFSSIEEKPLNSQKKMKSA